MLHTIIAALDILFYLAATALLARQVRARSQQQVISKAFISTLLVAMVMHCATMHMGLFKDHMFHLNIFNISPLIFFIIVAVLLPSLLKKLPVESLLIAALPLTALSIAVATWGPEQPVKVIEDAGLITHLVLSIAAYSLITIAALQAVLLSLQEHALRSHKLRKNFRFLPPLQTMEDVLFHALGFGFFLLSISILSGFIFLEDMFAQHLVHKTVLSIVAWIIFAILFYGRIALGWRGKTAAYWTIGGFVILMLAYFGSKFVLEIILQRL